MSKKLPIFSCIAVAFALALYTLSTSSAVAAEKAVTTTTVTVGEMCGGCVKRITARFNEEKSVAKVTCSIEKKTVTLIPAKNTRLNAVGVWEIFESIGKKPTKMVSPEGTFTSKPKQK